jgi:hypothetical protein
LRPLPHIVRRWQHHLWALTSASHTQLVHRCRRRRARRTQIKVWPGESHPAQAPVLHSVLITWFDESQRRSVMDFAGGR